MPVTGMMIKEIEARRTEDVVGELEVTNDTKLTTVEETDLPTLGKKGMRIGFSFVTNYNNRDGDKNKLAEIKINGSLLYMSDDHDKIVAMWKETNKLPQEINIEILNALLRRCVTKAIVISEDLQMPPPVMLPHAKRTGEPGNVYNS